MERTWLGRAKLVAHVATASGDSNASRVAFGTESSQEAITLGVTRLTMEAASQDLFEVAPLAGRALACRILHCLAHHPRNVLDILLGMAGALRRE